MRQVSSYQLVYEVPLSQLISSFFIKGIHFVDNYTGSPSFMPLSSMKTSI